MVDLSIVFAMFTRPGFPLMFSQKPIPWPLFFHATLIGDDPGASSTSGGHEFWFKGRLENWENRTCFHGLVNVFNLWYFIIFDIDLVYVHVYIYIYIDNRLILIFPRHSIAMFRHAAKKCSCHDPWPSDPLITIIKKWLVFRGSSSKFNFKVNSNINFKFNFELNSKFKVQL